MRAEQKPAPSAEITDEQPQAEMAVASTGLERVIHWLHTQKPTLPEVGVKDSAYESEMGSGGYN